jgi:hemolysin III
VRGCGTERRCAGLEAITECLDVRSENLKLSARCFELSRTAFRRLCARHAIGVCLGLIGAVTIVMIAVRIERIEIAPILVYVIGLVMLALSAAYNMWPVSPTKWILRRFDHSAIYLLIAGTYTPFLAQMKSVLALAGLGIGVWLSAIIGIALKLALPGRFDRLSVVLCLLLGWSGIIAYDSLASVLPSASLWLLAIGGILYSVGALFHVWQGLRFHNAIWHGFVVIAAVAIIRRSSLACHCPRRPRRRRAAEQHNELATLHVCAHSITSWARASSDDGTSKPSVLAVLRLITSSYLVGACTGRSAGFSPLRMRST